MATLTRLERDAPPLRTANLNWLEKLAGALRARGLQADVLALPARMPRLEVTNPATGCAGDVYAWRGQDGSWWYWWPWAERIAASDDLPLAAERTEAGLSPVPV